MLIANILTNGFGILVFLFLFWTRLKEDFASEIIFKLGFGILVGIFTGVILSKSFSFNYFLWLGFVGGCVGLSATALKFKSKFYEIFESFVISTLPWLSFIFLFDSVINSSLSSFLGFITILLLILISYLLNAHYKNFSWYKSGKIGFTGISVLALIFLIRFVLAIIGISMLSFVGKFEGLLSVIGISVCFTLLFILARKKE